MTRVGFSISFLDVIRFIWHTQYPCYVFAYSKIRSAFERIIFLDALRWKPDSESRVLFSATHFIPGHESCSKVVCTYHHHFHHHIAQCHSNHPPLKCKLEKLLMKMTIIAIKFLSDLVFVKLRAKMKWEQCHEKANGSQSKIRGAFCVSANGFYHHDFPSKAHENFSICFNIITFLFTRILFNTISSLCC